MNLLFTVCGRKGSKGLKNKNVANFLGQPLPYYTLSVIDLFKKAHENDYENIFIAINTDSTKLFKQIDKTKLAHFKVERKGNLATDTASKIDVIRDTLCSCERISEKKIDIVVDLDITSPLRTLADIEKALETLIYYNDSDLVFSVTDSRRNPYFNMVKNESGYYCRIVTSNYTARQQAPEIYDMNASIYAYRADFLKREGTPGIFDGRIKIVKMIDTAILDIDSEEDFKLMKVLARYFYKNNKELQAVKDNIKKIL